jgi:prepilin peptidase CpaA
MPAGEVLALAVLSLLAATGAWLDIKTRRLPNWLCLLTAAAGFATIAALDTPAWPWSGPLHAAGALAVGMALFAAGLIGGGDAKFYAALALWFPVGSAPLLAASIGLAGLVLLIIIFAMRRFFVAKAAGAPTLGPDFHKLPYGVAIAVGAMALALLQAPHLG